MSLTSISVKRPSLIVVIFTIITLLGIISYSTLNYELLPKISSPVLAVTTIYPGASPGEVENSVSIKIEDAVSSLEGVDKITSISQEGLSIVQVELLYNTDVDKAVQDAQRNINNAIADLPEQIVQPSVQKFSLDELPIMRLGISSNMAPVEFKELVENKIKEDLSRISGIAQVDITGGSEREIRINVDRNKLKAYNLSILQVTNAISGANLDFPTGKIKDASKQVLVRLSGKFKNVEDLNKQVISRAQNGAPIRISDIADVYDTQKETETLSRINGKSSIGLLISKQSDGNTVEVAESVKERIETLEKEYSDIGLKFTIAQDSSVFTLDAANAVIHDLIIAVILVALIMLFFLHSIRDALIVMISIPTSIVATFIVMNLLGFTLNLMTLLGLSLVVGILVDDSIVVIENIHSHIERGKSRWDAAISSWKEIGMSVTSITLVLIVVFLPITFVTGIIADLLRQFALVIAFATGISLFVSFTLTPLLASRFSKSIILKKGNVFHYPLIVFENGLNELNHGYSKALTWALNHKRITIGIVFSFVIASFLLFPAGLIGSEFTKAGDNGEFIVNIELPKESTLEQTNLKAKEVEEVLLNDPLIESVFTTVGRSSGSSGNEAFLAEINGRMINQDNREVTSSEFARDLKDQLARTIPGVKFKTAPVSMMGGGAQSPIQVIMLGDNVDSLIFYSEKVKDIIKSVPGTHEIEASVKGGNPEVNIQVDREKMALLGLTMQEVGATLQNSFAGNTDNKFRDGENEYDINVKLDNFDRKNTEDISRISFLNTTGELIQLQQFADIESSTGPSKLERKDKKASLTVSAQVVGRPEGTVGQEVQDAIGKYSFPESVSFESGGSLENQKESFISLGVALLMSIVLVYLIMVALYDSYVYPFVVMFSVPVALVGAFLALALALENLSIFTILGLIMLVGLVIKNAILIVDYANQLKEEGMDPKEAAYEAGKSRLRPVLMTAISMVIAMIPIAFATGAGSAWKNGLALVLMGGMSSSTILSMMLVPVVYRTVDEIKEKFSKKSSSTQFK